MAGLSTLLAHQGGWDEMLLVAAPIVVMGLLLRLANRRVERQLGTADKPEAQSSSDSTSAPMDTRRPTKSS